MAVINQGWYVQCDYCGDNVHDSITNGTAMTKKQAMKDACSCGWLVKASTGQAACPSCARERGMK